MAFYQKYRSQTFGDLIGQDQISRTLLAAIKQDSLSHAYLLTGPRGTGKTSTARLLAKSINCPNVLTEDTKTGKVAGEPCNQCEMCQSIIDGRAIDIIEIDAASHTGVDDIRDLIERAQLSPGVAKKKIYIIDEVHMLSKSAFNALLKTLEEPPSHVIFILATTEVQKLPATILSRTQRYDFCRVAVADLVTNLRRIASAENLEIDDESLELIALSSDGGHRDAVSLLDQIAGYSKKVSLIDVESILGLARRGEVANFLGAIFNGQTEEGLKIAHGVLDSGTDLNQFCREILDSLRKIMLCQVGGEALFDDTKENKTKLTGLAKKVGSDDLARIMMIFVESGKMVREVSNPILPIEMAVVEATSKLQSSAVSHSENNGQKIVSSVRASTDADDRAHDDISNSSLAPEVRGVGDNRRGERVGLRDKDAVIQKTNNSQSYKETDAKSSSTDTAAAPVLEMKADLWGSVVAVIKKENATLAALLRDAKPIGINDKTMTLGVKFKFHQDKISEAKNRDILEKALSEIVGNKMSIKCEPIGAKKIAVAPASDDELQKAVGEVFELG